MVDTVLTSGSWPRKDVKDRASLYRRMSIKMMNKADKVLSLAVVAAVEKIMNNAGNKKPHTQETQHEHSKSKNHSFEQRQI